MNTGISNVNLQSACISPKTENKTGKKSVLSRVKNWAKENIVGTEDKFVENHGLSDSAKENAKIGLSCAGSGASFLGAAGKEILSGQGAPQDKLIHTGGTFAVTVTLGALGLPPYLAAAVTFITVSVGKELIYDGLLGKGCVDIRDVAANMCGSLAGYAALKKLRMGNIKQ